jgi:hypothetical protein
MFYLDFLRSLHAALAPRTYLEVGVRDGRSLALSRARSIGVDPAFAVVFEVDGDVALIRTTSDEYFARPEPLAPTAGRPYDLTLIDGLHLFEFALRDFLHAEALSTPGSLIVLDDVLPRNLREASRSPATSAWTGDVYKMIAVLRRYRPELVVIPVSTRPTGLLLVMGLEPDNMTLRNRYNEIVTETVSGDPQIVPPEILNRECALAPERVLTAEVWSALREARDSGAEATQIRQVISSSMSRTFGPGVGGDVYQSAG